MRRNAWKARLAWRDARAGGGRLFLFVSAIIAGVAALVAVRSFADALEGAVDRQAKTLLGADLEIYGREPFDAEALALFERVADGSGQSTVVGTDSMAYFPRSRRSRLVAVRAVGGGFPYYGELGTEPPAAGVEFSTHVADMTSPDDDRSRLPGDTGADIALVDHNLMLQFDAEVGDPIRLGEVEYEIVGRLQRIPGEVPNASLIGPRVFVPLASLARTQLLRPGSRSRFSRYFKLDSRPEEVAELVGVLETDLRRLRLEAESVQFRRQQLGRSLSDLYDFLHLGALAALLLGAVGVASSVHLYVQGKLESAAVLRCLGAGPRDPVMVFALQTTAVAAVAAVVGVLLGVAAQPLIAAAVRGFLPVEIEPQVSWMAMALGATTGAGVALLFSLLPLLELRKIAPLRAIRAGAGASRAIPRFDPARLAVVAAIVLGTTLAAVAQSDEVSVGIGITAALALVLALLAVTAVALRAAVRRWLASSWPFAWRQGLANLYPPGNQTLVVMLALGFGVFVIMTLYQTQLALRGRVQVMGSRGGANMLLFDVQVDQVDGLRRLFDEHGLPVLQHVPVVPMRLAAVAGRPVEEFGDEGIRPWVLRRQYNSTYRVELADTEEIISGEWIGSVSLEAVGEEAGGRRDGGGVTGAEQPVPISLEESIAERLHVEVGDELTFNVQGLHIVTRVASLREVDWEQMRPNFFVVFPAGVLEEAPQQNVMVTKTPSTEVSAAFQRDVVEKYSNVSILDLALVLNTVSSVLDQISLGVRAMASFTLLAGLAVLAVALMAARGQRLREAVLLRTLGASGRQIHRIGLAEYLLLGGLAAATGLLLALAGAWGLARFVFEVDLALALTPLLATLLAISALTVAVGFLTGRGALRRPPLETLRAVGRDL